ncbi:unnamed protein product [Rhizoctonia solani]|uniref:Nephrocystin 3-like N-terminal domain-containing protein n=1 Tax=Rhizoctonia solani TaxID=456999 RepID=A0A8H3A090_9AGAM|nr:unnamed protein product [Rhizoctonia solani]
MSSSRESARVANAHQTLETLYDISQLLNTGLDRETLATCVSMIESGVNPEALAVSTTLGSHLKMRFRRKFKQTRDSMRNLISGEGTSRPDINTNAGPRSSPSPLLQKSPDISRVKWKSLREIAGVLRLAGDALGPLKQVVEIFTECVDMYDMAGAGHAEYDVLRVRLETLFEDLKGHLGENGSQTMTLSMENLCKSIQDELEYIRHKRDRSPGERYTMANDEADAILACYRRIEGHLQRLSLNANLSIWKIAQEQAADSRSDRMASLVDRLPSSLSAWYKSAEAATLKRRGCTPDTRVDVLASIIGWTRNHDKGTVYWLNGMAGTGKTTVAYSVCAELDAAHMLGASFFCSRLREECRNVNKIIPSIAYQLARFSRPFLSAISAVLEKEPDVHGSLPQIQFDALIAKPSLAVEHTLPEGLVVVIDALDECEDKESTGQMLGVLLGHSATLPIKFIVSSRPEPQIRDHMSDNRTMSRLVLHELDRGEVQMDIEKYLRAELLPMSPSEAQIRALVERAGILFIYAATAVRYIGYDNFHRNPSARLRSILNGPQNQKTTESKEIDRLYMTVLEEAFKDQGLEEADRLEMQQVLYTVICAREPLTVNGLSGLLQFDDVNQVRAALRPMWSVLHVGETDGLVTTLHASIPDFLFDPTRSQAYYCDSDAQNRQLAEHCFERIARARPRFNICGLESSYLPDESVSDIEERVARAISLELFYACRFWADHIQVGKCALNLVEQIQGFLSTHFLLWMEVLNLKKHMKAGVNCLKLTIEWCNNFENKKDLVDLAHDAHQFASTFALNGVSKSTPHIYVSMLAFWPSFRPISKHYANLTQGPIALEGTALEHRQHAHLATWRYPKSVGAIALSPDGLCIALAIGHDVLVVDSSSGKVILGPLRVDNHTAKVQSVVFSPDGTCIISGSINGSIPTILGWDTRTGDEVLGPHHCTGSTSIMTGTRISSNCAWAATWGREPFINLWDIKSGQRATHMIARRSIRSVAFSHTGTRIVSGSTEALQLWNYHTGDLISEFQPTHGDVYVRSVAFSPDDTRIISGYRDGILRVWNVQNRETSLFSINAHTSEILSIEYSADGRYILSGSSDRSAQVWDAQTGELVLGPLEGHIGTVNSAVFSSDSTRIISTCEGGLVCTCDIRPQDLMPGLTSGRFDRICSAKFSANGTRFVSGSDDGTIRIWDVDVGRVIHGPFKVHTSRIDTVDFLNDRAASGSAAGAICVYDISSNDLVFGPLNLYSENGIRAIGYSPDGRLIATGPRYGFPQVDIWDAQTAKRMLDPLRGLGGTLLSFQFSPDSTRICGSSMGNTSPIVVWDVKSGNVVFVSPEGHVKSVAYSPSGALIVSGSEDNSLVVRDANTGRKVLGPLYGHSGPIEFISFSHDNTRIVSSSADRRIKIWNAQSGRWYLRCHRVTREISKR